MSLKRKTRNKVILNILGETPGEKHLEIKGSRLPTHKQVLLCLLANINQMRIVPNKPVVNDAIKKVIEQITYHYNKGVPLVKPRAIEYRIQQLYNKFKNLKKNGKNISSPPEFLATTMPFWPDDYEESLKKKLRLPHLGDQEKEAVKVNLKFLESMKTDRIATYGGKNKALKRKRKSSEKKYSITKQTGQMPSSSSSLANIVSTSSDENLDDENEDKNFELPVSKKRPSKTGGNLVLQKDFVQNKILVAASRRLKISPSGFKHFMKTLVQVGEGNPEAYNLSYSYIDKSFRNFSQQVSESIKQDWVPPSKCLVHWDEKITKCLDGSDNEKRMAITVSGIKEVKLLGVPSLGSNLRGKFGATASGAIKKELDSWNCTKNIYGMVFDTTNSNTGRINGACVQLQKVLNRNVLWLACRHHVCEVILSNVWKSLKIEISSSPSINIFKQLQDNWSKLNGINMSSLFKPEEEAPDELVTFYTRNLEAKFVREDYLELVQVCLLYLNTDYTLPSFRKPGSISRARWMSKILYSLKLVLLSTQIKNHISLDDTVLLKLIQFTNFCVFVYVPWWITSPLASQAPMNDIKFMQQLFAYDGVDSSCASAALNAVSRHLWYLTGELIPLCLFDNNLTTEHKEDVAKKIDSLKLEVICFLIIFYIKFYFKCSNDYLFSSLLILIHLHFL